MTFQACAVAQEELFTATSGRDQANSYLNHANIGFHVDTGVVGVHDDFTTTAKGAASWSRDDRNRIVFEQLVSLLEAIEGSFQHLPLSLPCAHEHQEQVGPRGEVSRLVADDDCPELFLTLFDSIAQHVDDALVDRVHFGVELDTGYTISQVDKRSRTVIAYDGPRRRGATCGRLYALRF